MSFVDARRGWVGGAGVILATADGGATWSAQYRGREAIEALDFATAQDGWARGSTALLHTGDGGRHWDAAGEPPQPLDSLRFVTASAGWGTASAQLYESRDAGRTWQLRQTPVLAGAACFVDEHTGWIVAASGEAPALFATGDGGQTWQKGGVPLATQTFATYARVLLRCVAPATVWYLEDFGGAAGGDGYVLSRSTDGGRTWTAVLQGKMGALWPSPPPQGPAVPGDVALVDGTVAYLSGACGPCDTHGTTSVSRTTDGGSTWRAVEVGALPDSGGHALAFPERAHGWLLAHWFVGPDRSSGLFETSDGGRTWQYRDVTVAP